MERKKNPDVTLGMGVIKALELGCKNFCAKPGHQHIC